MVLNSCSTKDRRIISYEIKADSNAAKDAKIIPYVPTYLDNTFIRKTELLSENLKFCAGGDSIFVANLGTPYIFGLNSIETNTIENLGLEELGVSSIESIHCNGKNSIGVLFKNSTSDYNLATYYTQKLKDAQNRIHSTKELGKSAVRVSSSSDERLVFYNIHQEG